MPDSQPVTALQAHVSVMHLSNAHFSHALADAEAMQAPPSSPDEPPEPPVPVPVEVEELVEPADPLDVPPSLVSVVSVVHAAPRTTITADANAQPVIFVIVSLLAMGYFKLLRVRRTPVLRTPSYPPPAMMARVYLTIVSDESNCRRAAAIRQRSPLPFTGDSTRSVPPPFMRC